jgi:hypothetical protein
MQDTLKRAVLQLPSKKHPHVARPKSIAQLLSRKTDASKPQAEARNFKKPPSKHLHLSTNKKTKQTSAIRLNHTPS